METDRKGEGRKGGVREHLPLGGQPVLAGPAMVSNKFDGRAGKTTTGQWIPSEALYPAIQPGSAHYSITTSHVLSIQSAAPSAFVLARTVPPTSSQPPDSCQMKGRSTYVYIYIYRERERDIDICALIIIIIITIMIIMIMIIVIILQCGIMQRAPPCPSGSSPG